MNEVDPYLDSVIYTREYRNPKLGLYFPGPPSGVVILYCRQWQPLLFSAGTEYDSL